MSLPSDTGPKMVSATGSTAPHTARTGALHRGRRMPFSSPYEYIDWWKGELGPNTSFVYVIQAKGCSPIKIGTAKDVRARIATLQTGCWHELLLRHVFPGDHALEAELHRRLASSRLRGEWFHPSHDFLDAMQRFAQVAVDYYIATGRLPQAPPHRPDHPPVTVRYDDSIKRTT